MTADELGALLKNQLDGGLRVNVVTKEDGSMMANVTTSFPVTSIMTPCDVIAALKGHLIRVQAMFHSLQACV